MKKTIVLFASLAAAAASASAQESQPASMPATAPATSTPAPPPAPPTPPTPPAPVPEKKAETPPPPPVTAKWTTSLYGFVELDTIGDSTQSFQDLAGNGLIARTGGYAHEHGRLTMGVRNSRIGFKLGAPPVGSIKTSAQLEMDFLGNQPSNPPATSEGAFFGNPTFRIRHFNMKLETPAVDVMLGQYWQLFGWQSYFHPNTVEIQGVPGQVYSRVAQIRLGKQYKTGGGWAFDWAIAGSRPAQRDSLTPDGELGLRLTDTKWTGYRTAGGAGTSLDAFGIGVSGIVRHFNVVDFTDAKKADGALGWGFSIDAFVPIVSATKKSHDNALTLTGSFVKGQGIADQYSGLNGGAAFPKPSAMGATYTADVDNGLVSFDTNANLIPIHWQSFIVGLQYYLPHCPVFASVNFSQMDSDNIKDLVGTPPGAGAIAATSVITQSRWADVNVSWDVTPAVRLGLEYAWFWQHYDDGGEPTNSRVQFSAFYLF